MAQNTAPAMSGIGSPGKSGAVQKTAKSGNSQLGNWLHLNAWAVFVYFVFYNCEWFEILDQK